jgi:hypothetical protein
MMDFGTHIKGNRLDLILTNCPEKVINVSDEGRLGRSDHIMMMLKIDTRVVTKNNKKEIICWKKGRYGTITLNLSLIDWQENLSNLNTEEAWTKFRDIMHEQVRNEIPSFTPAGRTRPQWLNPEIRSLLTAKKKAWRRMKDDKSTKSRLEYEEAAKKVKKKIMNTKRKLERELANEEKGNGKKFRNYIKQRTRSRDPVGPLIPKAGTTITEDREIAEELNTYFASIFTKEDRTNLQLKEPETAEKLQSIAITKAKVIKKIKKLRPDSDPGPDNINRDY